MTRGFGPTWLACLALASACLGAPSVVRADERQPPARHLDARELQNVLLNIRRVSPERARADRDRLARDGRLQGAELALVDALVLEREGDLEGAERTLRMLLEADPDRRVVRFELARVLIRRKRYTAARFQLRRLQQAESDPDVSGVYRALDRRISRLRPWDVSLDVSAAPRTNANRGAQSDEFVAGSGYLVDEPFRARSAVGLRYGGSASYRFLLDPRFTLVTRGFAGGTEYEDDDLSTAYAGAGAVLSFDPAPRQRIDFGADLTRQWAKGHAFSGERSADIVTPSVAYRFPIAGPFTGQLRQSFSHVDHDAASLRDGWRGASTAAVTFAPRADRSATVSLRYDFDRAGLAYNRHDGLRGGLSLYGEFAHAITLDANAFGGTRRYEAAFPILGRDRRDDYWGVSLGLTKRDWALYGFAPRVSVSYERQTSNVARFDFDDWGASIGLSRGF